MITFWYNIQWGDVVIDAREQNNSNIKCNGLDSTICNYSEEAVRYNKKMQDTDAKLVIIDIIHQVVYKTDIR